MNAAASGTADAELLAGDRDLAILLARPLPRLDWQRRFGAFVGWGWRRCQGRGTEEKAKMQKDAVP